MDVKEYSDLVGVSKVSVTRRLKSNNPPKAIKSYKKYGNTYALEIDVEELKKLIERNKSRVSNGLSKRN